MKPKKTLALIVAAILICSFYPAETVTVPAWTVQFVDVKNQPLAFMPVEQTWQNYSVEDSAHSDFAKTDAHGIASFPERRLKYPLLFRVVNPVLKFSFHASYGNSSWLQPRCDLLPASDPMPHFSGASLPKKVVYGYDDRTTMPKEFRGNVVPECERINLQTKNANG
jgi:hypothetical protein